MKWYISLYKNLSNDLKADCDVKRGLYIVKEWTENTKSICPFNISNFVHVILMNDADW